MIVNGSPKVVKWFREKLWELAAGLVEQFNISATDSSYKSVYPAWLYCLLICNVLYIAIIQTHCCRLFEAKPLCESKTTYSRTIRDILQWNWNPNTHISIQKMHFEFFLQNGGYFVSVIMPLRRALGTWLSHNSGPFITSHFRFLGLSHITVTS